MLNALSIDVEDYFQVSAFEHLIPKEDWDKYPCRVEANVERILNILAAYHIKATFFILGWLAERYPQVVQAIDARGHEIACHSYYHRLIYDMSPAEFRADLQKAKTALEAITGKKVLGFRAPSYSITKKSLWALKILVEAGFVYDSSIFPVIHDRYGIRDFSRFPVQQVAVKDQSIMEFPLTTYRIMGYNLPIAGGGYLRLFPKEALSFLFKDINAGYHEPVILYFHPWEIDPGQPQIEGISPITRFRHYHGLAETEAKLRYLFERIPFAPVYEVLANRFKMAK